MYIITMAPYEDGFCALGSKAIVYKCRLFGNGCRHSRVHVHSHVRNQATKLYAGYKLDQRDIQGICEGRVVGGGGFEGGRSKALDKVTMRQ